MIKINEGNLNMSRMFRIRKLGPTELTWEEKNSADYRYYPDDDSKLRKFIEQNLELKEREMNTKEKVNRIMKYTDWLWKHWKYHFKESWSNKLQ